MLTVAVALLAGCGGGAAIERGGRVPGEILTVYTLVPDTAGGADLVRGAKLALARAGGRVGTLTVQFASAFEPDGTEAIAVAVRDVVRDTGTIAVIGDLDRRTAAVSAPLLNAVGLLHVSPLAPVRFPAPSGRRTFFAIGATPATQAEAIVRAARKPIAVETEAGSEALATAIRGYAGRTVATARARTVVYAGTDPVAARGVIDGVLRESRRARVITPAPVPARPRVRVLRTGTPPGFADAFPGVPAGPYARAGFDAMNAVLDALRRAGRRAQTRSAVIRAFRPPAPTRASVRG